MFRSMWIPSAFLALNLISCVCESLYQTETEGVLEREVCLPKKYIYVTIYSYDRPQMLHRLLLDLEKQLSSKFHVVVHVLDDNAMDCVPPIPAGSNVFDSKPVEPLVTQLVPASDNSDILISCTSRHRFAHAETVISRNIEFGWKLFVSHYRHGRRRYWHLVSTAHALLRRAVDHSQQLYFVFLPDDVRLSSTFVEQATAAWDAIEHPRKRTLMLHIEESRESAAVWTDLLPHRISNDLFRIGWVESGNFIADSSFLEFFNWSFPRVPISRWIRNPPISSGVGSLMSELLHKKRYRMYRTNSSLVAHVGTTGSKMNAAFRDPNQESHRTLYFIDGEETYRSFLTDAASVTASIASVWYREVALHSAVFSLAAQVDHINIYLNGYSAVPGFLRATYITVLLSGESEKGEIGDIGKFHWANNLSTEFHLTADDDISYPQDYVGTLVNFLQSHASPTVVGVHGIRIKQDSLTPANGRRGKGYYGSREVFMATEAVDEAHPVHILGTGTMLYRVRDLGYIDLEQTFSRPNMADIFFAIRGQELQVPFVVVPHAAMWVKEVPGTFENSIYNTATRRKHSDRHQTEAAISASPWKLHLPQKLVKH